MKSDEELPRVEHDDAGWWAVMRARRGGAQLDPDIRSRVMGIEQRAFDAALVLDAYSWLAEGRGPYAYDDAGYDEDVRRMIQELREALAGK